jgi:succinate dehydrogenase / fumarate reductase, cytochrome b subunit
MAEVAEVSVRSNQFLLRRLQSLTGIIPIGAFVVLHLLSNLMVYFNEPGYDYFQEQVNRIHALGPLLVTTEILFIFLPIAFHAAIGIKIWLEGKPNSIHYPYWGNVRYTLQRITGVVALIFIIVHVWHMHWLGGRFGGGMFDPNDASATAAWALQAHRSWAQPLYVVGVLAVVFHFANGIWTFLITWGITVGRQAQRKSGYVCAIFGIGLAVVGLFALRGFMIHPDPRPPETPYVAPGEGVEPPP